MLEDSQFTLDTSPFELPPDYDFRHHDEIGTLKTGNEIADIWNVRHRERALAALDAYRNLHGGVLTMLNTPHEYYLALNELRWKGRRRSYRERSAQDCGAAEGNRT